MLRVFRAAITVTVALTVASMHQAHAQYGYGGYGWGGWGGTGSIGGDNATGLGYFEQGLGVYNLDTAQADAINTDTVMRWNDYMWRSQQVANRAERQRIARRQKYDSAASDAIQKRLRENPTDEDIADGNALNVILDEVSDPKIHSSALRLATTKLPGKLVRAIPFINASEAVTISLDQLTAKDSWPSALLDPKFDDDRKAYSDAVDKALAEDTDGEISPASLKALRESLRKIRTKLEAKPPQNKAEFGESEIYLKTLYGMTGMLAKPKVEKIIAELEKVKETSLASLLGFMHTYNLRFGRPTDATQREAYEELYPLMVAHRDRVMKGVDKAAKTDDAGKNDRPPAFFKGMHLDHLEGKNSADPAGK